MSILSIITSLASTSSSITKESILNHNINNLELKETFRLALDPLLNFYIKGIPPARVPKSTTPSMSLRVAMKMLEDEFATRKLTGNDAKHRLAVILDVLSNDDAEIIKRIIGRNLKCGVSEGIIKKVWDDLVLSYPCMLVSPMDSSKKIKFPVIVQTKMDGMRFNAVVREFGDVSYYSRNGKVLDLKNSIDECFRKSHTVYDGELLVIDTDGKILDRKTGNGILTKFQKGTGTHEESRRIRAVIWDAIPLDEFKSCRCVIPYSERFDCVKENVGYRVSAVCSQICNSMDEINAIYQENLKQGEEGVIIKDPKSQWEDKRVKHQMKLKAELEADLFCESIIPGTGKYQNLIGSLACISSDGKVRVSVGTGLTDSQRYMNPNFFIGKIISVKYNARIQDKTGGPASLFLPVFVEVRIDKTVADTSDDIK